MPEGRSREECIEIKKEREQELKLLMKRLEAKYAALQVVPVITKLGTQRVSVCHGISTLKRSLHSEHWFHYISIDYGWASKATLGWKDSIFILSRACSSL